MSAPIDLGTLINAPQNDNGIQPPDSYHEILEVAATDGDDPKSDKEIVDKAVADSKESPSIWFVNFPDKTTVGQQALLADYMQNVQDYQNWASLVWWRTVYNSAKIPKDDKPETKAIRRSFLAKVATKHMRLTPWLGMTTDHSVTKEIDCRITEFHTDLIVAVLKGFVSVTPSIYNALEGILVALKDSMKQVTTNSDNKTIVCERYEYIPEANVIRSYVRVVSFAVNEKIREINNAKKTESHVKCTISYDEYEANFNQKLWGMEAAKMEELQKKAADAFRKQQTVDCDADL